MKRDITVIGIDIAKRVFHVIGMDTWGTIILRKRLYRGEVMGSVAKFDLGGKIQKSSIRNSMSYRTPALAAGLTDHVWTFRELRTAKCTPLDSQRMSG
jgi:hypothetical protein